jgi:hypothetical protein
MDGTRPDGNIENKLFSSSTVRKCHSTEVLLNYFIYNVEYGAANYTFLYKEKMRNVYGPVVSYWNGRESTLTKFQWRTLSNHTGTSLATNMIPILYICSA